MNVKLLKDAHYPAGWVIQWKPIRKGTIVPAVPASNLPDCKAKGLLWINTPELKDDAYGILLSREDYEIVEE